MLGLLFDFLLVGANSLSITIVQLLYFYLQRLDLLLQTTTLTIEHLTNRRLLFYHLLDLAVLLVYCTLQLHDLVLKTFNVFLVIDTHLFDLTLVHLVQLQLQSLLVTLGKPLSLNKFIPKQFVLLLSENNRVLIASLLLIEFGIDLFHFNALGLQQILQLRVLQLKSL